MFGFYFLGNILAISCRLARPVPASALLASNATGTALDDVCGLISSDTLVYSMLTNSIILAAARF